MSYRSGDLKQEIIRIYNQVNQDLFDVGTKQVRVELLESCILIYAGHKRSQTQSVIEKKYPLLSQITDAILLDEFKARLKCCLIAKCNLPIKAVLKDYDPETETAATIIFLK